MKIVFFSNFLNLHQLPLCEAFLEMKDIDFTFVATEALPTERLSLKYEDMNHKYSFVVCAYDSSEAESDAMNLAETADIAIIGSAPSKYLHARMSKRKLTFRFCERSLKKGTWRRYSPITYLKIWNEYIKYKNNNLFVLAAGAFTSYDLWLCGFPEKKCFKWGYFPPMREYNIDKLMKIKREGNERTIHIVWVARLIPLKRPEMVINLAQRLKSMNLNFKVDMIGNGIMLEKLKKMVSDLGLCDRVFFCGSIASDAVRSYMEKSAVFLFTSNNYEGWGAVVNESMNSGCAVVSSHVVGSAPYLIKHGENGLFFKDNDLDSLVSCVKMLIENPDLCEKLGRKAYDTIRYTWNARNAAIRFIELVKCLPDGSAPFLSGPCSPAELTSPYKLSRRWLRK